MQSLNTPLDLTLTIDIKKVEPMTDKVYYDRGMTALLDVIGKTINVVSASQKNFVPSATSAKTVVVIMTDGMENASKEYKLEDVKRMIELQQKEYGWEFLFMGANIDAVKVTSGMGISANRAANYHADAWNGNLLRSSRSGILCRQEVQRCSR